MEEGCAKPGDECPIGKGGRVDGVVATWVEERGFGWVDHNGTRFYAHIRAFRKGRVPAKGDEVSFEPCKDPLDRLFASNLILKKPHEGPGVWACLQVAVLLVLPLMAGFRLPGPAWIPALWVFVVSSVAWRTYRSDKKAAQAGAWRVSETMLHSLEILGGWPGAFLAQRRYLHKTRKMSYQGIFQSIVFLYQLVSLDLLLDHRLWSELVQMLAESGLLDAVR